MDNSLYEICKSWLNEKPLQVAVDEAHCLLESSDPSASEHIIDSLLSAVILHNNIESSILSSIAALVRKIGSSNLQVGVVLLSHLASFSDPSPFIEIVPSIFGVASPAIIEEAFEELHSLACSDSRFILCVISALIDLPLSPQLRFRFAELAEDAITVVDESDIPFLFRVLIKNIFEVDGARIIRKIREEIAPLPMSTLSLVLEAMRETLPACPKAAHIWLSQVYKMAISTAPVQPDTLDVAAVLFLSGDCADGTASVCSRIVRAWLASKVFPFGILKTVIKLRSSNEVWSLMIPGIWRMAGWLLDRLPHIIPAHTERQWPLQPNGLLGDVISLFKSVYRHAVELREAIVKTLIRHCYGCEHHGSLSPLPIAARTGRSLPPVRVVLAEKLIAYAGGKRDLRDRLAISKNAVVILENIVSENLETVGSVLTSLIDRIHAPSIEKFGYNQYKTNMLELPCPYVLHRIIMCITKSIGRVSSLENTLLIVIQKLLGQSAPSDPAIEHILVSQGGFMVRSGASTVFRIEAGTEDAILPPSQQLYSRSAVGVLIAGYMFDQMLLLRSQSFVNQDLAAILSWIQRCVSRRRDYSVAYALDVLAVISARMSSTSEYFGQLQSTLQVCWDDFCSGYPNLFRGEKALKAGEKALNATATAEFHLGFSHLHNSANNFEQHNLSMIDYSLACVSVNMIKYMMSGCNLSSSTTSSASYTLRSLVWMTYRAACVHGRVYALRSNSTFGKLCVHLILSTHESVSSCVDDKILQVRSCWEEFSAAGVVSVDQGKVTDPLIPLQLALEFCLAGSVLMGYLRSGVTLFLGGASKSLDEDSLLCRCVAFFSQARHFLRVCETVCLNGATRKSSIPTNGPHQADMKMLGKKRKAGTSFSNLKVCENNGGCDISDISNKIKILICQLSQDIDRMTCHLPVVHMKQYLALDTVVTDPQRLANVCVNLAKKNSFEISDALTEVSCPLFSNMGLYIATYICRQLFTAHREITYNHKKCDVQNNDEFIFQFNISGNFSTPSGSSSYSSTDIATPMMYASNIITQEETFFHMCSLLPIMRLLSERLRTVRGPELQCGGGNEDNFPCSLLDYNGYSLLISILYMSLDMYVSEKCAWDQDSSVSLVDSPIFNKMIRNFIMCNFQVLKVSEIRTEKSSSRFVSSSEYMEDCSAEERLVYFYSIVEQHVVSTLNSVVSLTGMKFLFLLTKGTRLSRRISSLAWSLLKEVHEFNPQSIFPHASSSVVSNTLKEQLKEYLFSLPGDLMTVYWKHTYRGVGNFAKVVNQCKAVMNIALSPPREKARPSSSLFNMSENESFQVFRACFIQWWYSECSTKSYDHRVYGLFLVLMEAILHSRSSDTVQSVEDETLASSHSQRIDGSYQSLRRTARSKRPVVRFTPESGTAETRTRVSSGSKSLGAEDINNEVDGVAESLYTGSTSVEPNSYLYMSCEIFRKHDKTGPRIRRVSPNNFSKYLSFALCFVPSILVLARPTIPNSNRSKKDKALYMGPYFSAIHAMQLFVFVVLEFDHIIVQRKHLHTVASLASLVVRVCRTVILSLETVLITCFAWRDKQCNADPSVSTPMNSDTSVGQHLKLKVESQDWASPYFLYPVFGWCLLCIDSVQSLSQTLTDDMVKALYPLPKGLVRSVPQMRVHTGKARANIMNWMHTYCIEKRDVDDLVHEHDWLSALYCSSLMFDSIHSSRMNERVCVAEWIERDFGEELSSWDVNVDLRYPENDKANNPKDDLESDNEFVVESNGQKGWGDHTVSIGGERLSEGNSDTDLLDDVDDVYISSNEDSWCEDSE